MKLYKKKQKRNQKYRIIHEKIQNVTRNQKKYKNTQ